MLEFQYMSNVTLKMLSDHGELENLTTEAVFKASVYDK